MSISHFENEYDSWFRRTLDTMFALASTARGLGLDPSDKAESVLTLDLAERVEKSVGPPGIAGRIRELTNVMPREEVAFKVAEELAVQGVAASEKAAEQAVRTALAILDEGVTVAPIQGITSVRIKSNGDGSNYLAIYFAGPIRSAGGTEMALTLVVADYVRHLLGLDRYKATEAEAKRFVEELRLYEREVARFQYKIPDDELLNTIMNLTVEPTGVETDPFDVASFRNLPRIETNRVRGGALRVVNDGLLGRRHKALRIVEKLGIAGWKWLTEMRTPASGPERSRESMYMEDVIAGRPIFSFPSAQGGFRLRYGKARDTGLAALGVHPATMILLRNFIASGTQLRIEKPGKAGVALPVDSIEGPIVKLRDGSVLRVDSPEQARAIEKSVQSLLYLGDLLVAFGEFLENNRPLEPSGFVEEWWAGLLKRALSKDESIVEEIVKRTALSEERLRMLVDKPLQEKPSAREALRISLSTGVPLHPKYTYRWNAIDTDELSRLRYSVASSKVSTIDGVAQKIELEYESGVKTTLEKLWVPHLVSNGKIIVAEDAPILHGSLGIGVEPEPGDWEGTTLDIIKKLSTLEVRDKAPVFVGARMGRPEKARRREMTPLVHCLHPVGLAGGSRRDIREAASRRFVSVELPRRRCPTCAGLTYANNCPNCKAQTYVESICPRCSKNYTDASECPLCKVPVLQYERRTVNLEESFNLACRNLHLSKPPDIVKGVRGLTSPTRTPEPIEKGILRAKYDLSVFKDGTIRFDVTNAPLTHFKPSEVGVSLERLRALGYQYDCEENPLTNVDQLCALRIQDIIVPHDCAEYLVRVASFIDELLEKLYRLPPFYRIRQKEDLAGHVAIGLSPHTSVGVVARIIGFTQAHVCFAHPLWHAAKRRDCDGDEDAILLAMDVLLNFSKAFLPTRIGGLMDAPLLLTMATNPAEVARQALNMDIAKSTPLAFYEETQRRQDPNIASDIVECAFHVAEGERHPYGFTHVVTNINIGNHESAYKALATMGDKIREQLTLAETIIAVRHDEVAKRVLSAHLMRDIMGNLKAFTGQRFRCTKCNTKFRRIPLREACLECGGQLSLTVHRGTIEKYVEIAGDLVNRYEVGSYNEQRLRLLKEEIASLFSQADRGEQHVLSDFV